MKKTILALTLALSLQGRQQQTTTILCVPATSCR